MHQESKMGSQQHAEPPRWVPLDYGRAYIMRGWRVLPLYWIKERRCSCDKKECSSAGKHPITMRGVHEASDNADMLNHWRKQFPHANIGIATGNGLLVVDIDPRHEGSLAALKRSFAIPETATVYTGGGGCHLYMTYDPALKIGNSANKLGKGIDTRGDGGYVVAPPSIHASGMEYKWNPPLYQLDTAPAPDDLLAALLQPNRKIFTLSAPIEQPIQEALPNQQEQKEQSQQVKITSEQETSSAHGQPQQLSGVQVRSHQQEKQVQIPEGQRNTVLTRVAGMLRKVGVDHQTIAALLDTLNERCCDPPISAKEVESIALSASNWDRGALTSAHGSMIDLETLLEMDIPEQHWAVPNFLPEGVTLLAGKPKAGKSWLALLLALKIALGSLFLGMQCKAGPVLYLGLEDSDRRMQDRARKLLQGEASPSQFMFARTWLPLDQGGLPALTEWFQSNEGGTVIVDVFGKVRPPQGKGANAYEEDYKVIATLNSLALSHHGHIVLIHHLRKQAADSRNDEISGSTGLTGAADCLMVLQRNDDESDGKLHITGRDIEEQTLYLSFDKETMIWEKGEQPADKKGQPFGEQLKVLNYLKEVEEPQSPKQIAEQLGKTVKAVDGVLQKLVYKKLIHKTNYGHYIIPTASWDDGELA